jgi:hypothetical protein
MRVKFTILFLLFCQFLLAQNDTTSTIKPKLGIISLDKLNVVYCGIQNPLAIIISNVKSFTFSGLGLKEEKGKYSISPAAGNEVFIPLEIIC